MAQVVDQFVTQQTSLQQVKELLNAGIGCITYLRGLFPEESFVDHKLLAPRPPMSRSATNGKNANEAKQKDDPQQMVRVKQLKRGASSEVDKLMDYLDVGATEAIEKGFLQQLIFAIYLDPDDPSNVVECYSFTFSYETDSKGNRRPELVVQNQLSGMVISSTSSSAPRPEDCRKEGEVRRQVQQMIRNIITSTQLLDELPRRRFLNIRLHYTDDTPTEYEPPSFKPVPINSPGWTITTPTCDELPDASTLGSMSTGFHGVSVHTVSVAHLLDTAYDESISLDEALSRNKQDAGTRTVVWDAEALATSITDEDARIVEPEPFGVKDEKGRVVPFESVKRGADERMEGLRKKIGLEFDPNAVVLARGELEESFFDSNLSDNENLRRAIDAADPKPRYGEGELPTQPDPVVNRQRSYRPPVPLFDETNEQYAARIDQQHAPQAGPSNASGQLDRVSEMEEDAEMGGGPYASPSVETQLFEYSQVGDEVDKRFSDDSTGPEPDTIKTISQPVDQPVAESSKGSKKTATKATARKQVDPPSSVGPQLRKRTRNRMKLGEEVCECGDKDEDGAMICCGKCGTWKHVVCYGFASDNDDRIPDDFVCYRCRAEKSTNESLHDASQTREHEIEEALAGLRSLALFRPIAVTWDEGLFTMKELAKRLSIDKSTANQVLKRLQVEEFVQEKPAPSSRLKGKGTSQVGSLKKGPLVVQKTAKSRKRKAEYFSPGEGAEYEFSSKLDTTVQDVNADADSETDDLSRESSPEAPASKAHLYPSSKPLPPTTSTARAPAILVAATPSPAAASLAAAAQSDSMDEDDPILDVSQRTQAEAIFPFYWTPQDTITSETGGKSESAPKDPPLPPSKQQQQGTPKQPPVTMVDRKGKGEGVVDGTELSARDTSSKKHANPSSALADVDMHDCSISSASKGKRSSSDLDDYESDSASSSGKGTKKMRKTSEAEQQLEV